ncbi:MAG TPA: hypothetical protein VGF45_13580, partial [Polyangia bacterium]
MISPGTAPAPSPGRRDSSGTFARQAFGKFIALALAAACTSEEEATYSIEVTGPPNAFVGATSVSLLLRDREVAKTAVPAGGSFSLEFGGINPTNEPATVIAVRAVSADNRVVAYGQSPQIEVRPEAHVIRLFVQPPGTFARTRDLAVPLTDNFLVSADVRAQSPLGLAMTVPLFGLGRTAAGVPSSLLYVYDPISHTVQEIGRTRFARTQVTAFSRSSGEVVLFGGKGTPTVGEEEKTN